MHITGDNCGLEASTSHFWSQSILQTAHSLLLHLSGHLSGWIETVLTVCVLERRFSKRLRCRWLLNACFGAWAGTLASRSRRLTRWQWCAVLGDYDLGFAVGVCTSAYRYNTKAVLENGIKRQKRMWVVFNITLSRWTYLVVMHWTSKNQHYHLKEFLFPTCPFVCSVWVAVCPPLSCK